MIQFDWIGWRFFRKMAVPAVNGLSLERRRVRYLLHQIDWTINQYNHFIKSITINWNCIKDTFWLVRDSFSIPLETWKSFEFVMFDWNLQLGAVRFSRAGPSLHWITSTTASLGSITSIDFYDVADRGVQQLIVGTDDGFVHLYEVNVDGDHITHPSLIFSKVITFLLLHSNTKLMTNSISIYSMDSPRGKRISFKLSFCNLVAN